MARTFLAIDSSYEQLTQIASSYREQHVYPYLQTKGYQRRLLTAAQSQRETVKSLASDPATVYLTGAGHGTDSSFLGYQNAEVFAVGRYEAAEVEGKIAHLVSCSSAAILGIDFVQNGCRAFFGYNAPFAFDLQASGVFFECDGMIDRALAEGASAAEAVLKATALFEQRISEAKEPRIAAYLRFNLNHLCSPSANPQWGDASARLQD
jgi:hypothetical protein